MATGHWSSNTSFNNSLSPLFLAAWPVVGIWFTASASAPWLSTSMGLTSINPLLKVKVMWLTHGRHQPCQPRFWGIWVECQLPMTFLGVAPVGKCHNRRLFVRSSMFDIRVRMMVPALFVMPGCIKTVAWLPQEQQDIEFRNAVIKMYWSQLWRMTAWHGTARFLLKRLMSNIVIRYCNAKESWKLQGWCSSLSRWVYKQLVK